MVFNNLFTSLNIDSNPNLEHLLCSHNQISNITLNNPNPNLKVLDFQTI